MDDKREELFLLVAEAARKYAGCDSTSVTYETSQMLLEGILYCIDECRCSARYGLTGKNVSLAEQYRRGREIVLKKASEIRRIYNERIVSFEDYEMQCLRDTVRKGIPEFLKRYDARYFPQNEILTLDYPVLTDISARKGVDAVYEFMCAVEAEQQFLKRFEREYVKIVLEAAIPGYESMIENIGGILLMNTIGHLAVGKPLSDRGFTTAEYEKLSAVFSGKSEGMTEALLRHLIDKMVAQVYEENPVLLEYLQSDSKNMAVRIVAANEHGYMNRIFVV